LQAGGRGFESRHVHQPQSFQGDIVEIFQPDHLLLKQGVRGSNRLTSTKTLVFSCLQLTLQFQPPIFCRIFLEHLEQLRSSATRSHILLARPLQSSGLFFRLTLPFIERAGQVFIAMSFRESKTLDGVQEAFEEAIKLFNDSHPSSPLLPLGIDKQGGESFEIPARVFQEIDNCRLVSADLTDEKQNV
jgi:hypothetical protein